MQCCSFCSLSVYSFCCFLVASDFAPSVLIVRCNTICRITFQWWLRISSITSKCFQEQKIPIQSTALIGFHKQLELKLFLYLQSGQAAILKQHASMEYDNSH